MASATVPQPIYNAQERVLCYHGPLIYEAKVLKTKTYDETSTTTGAVGPHYLVHYKGWKQTYVPASLAAPPPAPPPASNTPLIPDPAQPDHGFLGRRAAQEHTDTIPFQVGRVGPRKPPSQDHGGQSRAAEEPPADQHRQRAWRIDDDEGAEQGRCGHEQGERQHKGRRTEGWHPWDEARSGGGGFPFFAHIGRYLTDLTAFLSG